VALSGQAPKLEIGTVTEPSPLARPANELDDVFNAWVGLACDVEGADSESVDELLEEGNAFEADVVTGVEDAGNAEEKEVHIHEVPEDDVPEEYLEKE